MAALISAIVPTYQRSAFLAETLEALLGQTRPLHQIIVWDDGSTDATRGVVDSAMRTAPNLITYHHDVNGGKSRALNRALTHATGDYIWICDDDDISLPDAAKRLGDALDTSTADLSAGAHLRFTTSKLDGEKVVSDAGYWPDLTQGSLLRHTLEDIFFFQNGSLVRRSALDKAGPFREDLARSIDLDMTVRLLARGAAKMVEGPVFLQRKHSGSRGPAAARHDAARMQEVWRNADRQIFAELRDVLPLSLYCAMFESDIPALNHRAALIQRATVYARRCDWTAALEDFAEAAIYCPEHSLTRLEWEITLRAMAGKHGARDAFSTYSRRAIIQLAKKGPIGRMLAKGLARGARWRLRAATKGHDAVEAIAIARFIATLGISCPAPPQDDNLRERKTLLPEAYTW